MKGAFLYGAGLFAAATFASQLQSQNTIETADPFISEIIVYGDDSCPPSTSDEIIVCARRPDGDRYRIPEPLREPGDPDAMSWAVRAEALEMVLDTGIQSCSTVGPGGFTGCWAEMMRQARRGRMADPEGGRVP